MKTSIRLFTGLLCMLTLSIAFADSGLTIEDPYVRAVPPGQANSAAFMLLTNHGDTNLTLQQASSDIAEVVELHEHVKEDDMMVMRQVQKIDIAAGSMTVLKPGGYHVMLIGLKEAIKPGDIIDISLEFDDGSTQTINAEVRKIDVDKMKKMHMKMKNSTEG